MTVASNSDHVIKRHFRRHFLPSDKAVHYTPLFTTCQTTRHISRQTPTSIPNVILPYHMLDVKQMPGVAQKASPHLMSHQMPEVTQKHRRYTKLLAPSVKPNVNPNVKQNTRRHAQGLTFDVASNTERPVNFQMSSETSDARRHALYSGEADSVS